MAVAAIVLYAVLVLITFGVRVAIQLRLTGSTGLHGLSPDASRLEQAAGVLFVLGGAMCVAAPILALINVVDPMDALDGAAGQAIGVVLAVAGIVATFGAQLSMGASWRVGVDPAEQTTLVTDGPFGIVRNPIYSAMLPTVFGLLLMVPSALAITGFALLLLGIELQVRLVEEPYLLKVHGSAYSVYASRVGRFLPRLGLLR
jgi:protein-S-isoprenylcysteine O-methyltransferase Ste14